MKIKICFLVDSIFSIGGVQRVTAVIAKELAKEHEVTIVTFDSPNKGNTSIYGLNESKIHYRFFSYPHIGCLKKIICKVVSGLYIKLRIQAKWASDIYAHSSFPSELKDSLAKELRQENYDVIIGVHAPLAARLANLRKEFPNIIFIGWLHNSYDALFGEDSMYIGPNRKRHYIYQFEKLNTVVVLCKNDADLFHEYDSNFSPVVIYNPLTLKTGVLSKGTSKRFLSIGRFTPLHKGFDLLIEAFHLFSKQNNEWMLDIVGEGPEDNTYKSLIHKYNLENRISFHPFTYQIQEYYSNSQIYVLSSRWEGMPLVLVEAMSHGLPIVTSNLPVCKEILGNSGLFFRNGDIIDLAAKLDLATKIDWATISQQSINIAKRYNIDEIIKQWSNIIEK